MGSYYEIPKAIFYLLKGDSRVCFGHLGWTKACMIPDASTLGIMVL